MMSSSQLKNLDYLYKAFVVGSMSLCIFFLVRLVNTLDKNVEDVQQLKVQQAQIQTHQAQIQFTILNHHH